MIAELRKKRGGAITRREDVTSHQVLSLPPHSTTALPGTPEKIEVMRLRVTDGFHPHHPDDSKAPKE